ncbi:hypothetical protein [Acaryochloris marina]|uniref:hypothetical protein n=1 Tax=Acaryochloris marina TaxID=155978 RepID=UPI0021C4B380|nr:hypothetical protein [Acaryochloris marina]
MTSPYSDEWLHATSIEKLRSASILRKVSDLKLNSEQLRRLSECCMTHPSQKRQPPPRSNESKTRNKPMEPVNVTLKILFSAYRVGQPT